MCCSSFLERCTTNSTVVRRDNQLWRVSAGAEGRTLLTAQRVCEHTYHYDGLGRPIHDCVCAFNLYKLINLRSRPGPDIAFVFTSPLPNASGQLDAHLNSLMLRKQHGGGMGKSVFTLPKKIKSTGRLASGSFSLSIESSQEHVVRPNRTCCRFISSHRGSAPVRAARMSASFPAEMCQPRGM